MTWLTPLGFLLMGLVMLPLGMNLSGRGPGVDIAVITVLAGGAVAVRFWSQQRLWIWLGTGLTIWILRNERFMLYLLLAAGIAGLLLHRPLLLLLWLSFVGLLVPKLLYFYHHQNPEWHGWLDEAGMSLVLLATLYYWREHRDGRLRSFNPLEWMTFLFFPSNTLNPVNFAPSDFQNQQRLETSLLGAWKALGLAACKALVLWLAWKGLGSLWYSKWPIDDFERRFLELGLLQAWAAVCVTYLLCVVWLSGTADVAVAIARFHGLDLPYNYRWALLAWNPVELWRRWAIFNRRLLLKLVYFPLGGRERHPYLNILLTFLASALVLHTGWFGSKYPTVGGGMTALFCAYFLGQGLAVCGCVFFWKLTGKDPGSDRQLRWSPLRVMTTLLTQGFSAWWHLLILIPYGVPWEQRIRLMLKLFCLDGPG